MTPRLERTTFRSYSGLFNVQGDLACPRDLDELKATVAWAREQGRTLSFSGSGLSFDNQYMSSDLVVSLRHLNTIRVSRAEKTIVLACGARATSRCWSGRRSSSPRCVAFSISAPAK